MKKHELLSIICFLFSLYGCKFKESKSANEISKNKFNEVINREEQIDSIKTFVIEKIQNAPKYNNLGSKSLMNNFPKNWSIYDDNPKKIKEKYDFNSLQSSLSNKISLGVKVSKSDLLGLLQKSTSEEIILNKIQNDSISINVSYLNVNSQKVYSILFRAGTDCNNCEYGSYLDAKYFMTIEDNEITDVILVSFEYHLSIISNYKYYFIEDGVINTKSFLRQEYNYDFLEYKKYTINNGKFVKD